MIAASSSERTKKNRRVVGLLLRAASRLKVKWPKREKCVAFIARFLTGRRTMNFTMPLCCWIKGGRCSQSDESYVTEPIITLAARI